MIRLLAVEQEAMRVRWAGIGLPSVAKLGLTCDPLFATTSVENLGKVSRGKSSGYCYYLVMSIDLEQRRKDLDEQRLLGVSEDQLKAIMYQRMAIAGRRMDEKIAKAKQPILRIRNWKARERIA